MINVLIATVGNKLIRDAANAKTAAILATAIGVAGTLGAVGMEGAGKILVKIATKK